ncbi:hypothetical protein ES703_35891 [subsurface metagenome]
MTPIKNTAYRQVGKTHGFANYILHAILFTHMRWEIEFYQDSQGNTPVQEFILGQSAKVQAKLLHFIDMLQDFGMSLGQPYIKKLRNSDVWELRIRHSSNYYRILYFAFSGQKFILLHAFLKTAKGTPKGEIEIAQDRINDYKYRYGL